MYNMFIQSVVSVLRKSHVPLFVILINKYRIHKYFKSVSARTYISNKGAGNQYKLKSQTLKI